MGENGTIKTIGVLTSGGDAPGMNAAIRAVVRRALAKGLKVKGVLKGYEGLIEGKMRDLHAKDVSNIIGRGGTILYSARCQQMHTLEGQEKAARICRENGDLRARRPLRRFLFSLQERDCHGRYLRMDSLSFLS